MMLMRDMEILDYIPKLFELWHMKCPDISSQEFESFRYSVEHEEEFHNQQRQKQQQQQQQLKSKKVLNDQEQRPLYQAKTEDNRSTNISPPSSLSSSLPSSSWSYQRRLSPPIQQGQHYPLQSKNKNN